MGVEGAMAVKRAVEAQCVLEKLYVSSWCDDEKAEEILGEVARRERDSKPAGTSRLVLL